MPAPQQFLEFIDANANNFIKRLADAVAIPRSFLLLSRDMLFVTLIVVDVIC